MDDDQQRGAINVDQFTKISEIIDRVRDPARAAEIEEEPFLIARGDYSSSPSTWGTSSVEARRAALRIVRHFGLSFCARNGEEWRDWVEALDGVEWVE